MRGVHVLCWIALKEIKRSEGWICTGVLFASWSQLVTWDKWAEVGNDHKNTVVIAIKACWMPVGRLLLYRRRFTYSHRHCMLVFAVLECVLIIIIFFFSNYPKLMYETKTQFQPGQGSNNLTAWGVSPIWHVTFVLLASINQAEELPEKTTTRSVLCFLFIFIIGIVRSEYCFRML